MTTTPYENGQPQTQDAVTVTYSYNPDGIRIKKTVNGTETNYIIDSYNHTGYAQVFSEVNGTSRTDYVFGLDVLSEATDYDDPTDVQYLLYDGQGTVRQISDSGGEVIDGQTHYYDAYGGLFNWTAEPASNIRYTGQQWDNSAQQYYLRARYYDPLNGRFNRVDPYSGNNQDPQSLHKYLYAHANPVNGIDPSGQSFIGAALYYTALFVVGLIIVLLLTRIGIGAIDIYWTVRGRCGTCGHNVSEKFRDVISRIDSEINNLTPEEKSLKCSRRNNPVVGWDIEDLFTKRVKGWTGTCSDTATLDGNCYSQGAINYYLWGRTSEYCGETLQEAKSKVTRWKMFRGGELDIYEQALAFTEAGWYGKRNFEYGETTRYSFKKCKANATPTTEDLWEYQWGDTSENLWDWWKYLDW